MLDPQDLAAVLDEIGRTRMPFGKYGPEHYPPAGVPLCDLPIEYLQWFRQNGGFPRSRLGELMNYVYHLKADGSDVVFEPVRRRNGGRTRLRPNRRKSFRFDNDADDRGTA